MCQGQQPSPVEQTYIDCTANLLFQAVIAAVRRFPMRIGAENCAAVSSCSNQDVSKKDDNLLIVVLQVVS